MSGSRSTPQLAVREQAEHAQRRHHHGREDGVVDRDAGEPHGDAPRLRTAASTTAGALAARRRRGARRRALATTLACAPSFRLSKRAASTWVSAARPLLTSTRPAAGSLRPVMTMRRTSAPFSIVHTKSWPDAWPTAPAGTVRRAASSASSTRAWAYWPARSARPCCRARRRRRSRACRPRPPARSGRSCRAPARAALDPDLHLLARAQQRDLVRADRAGELERAEVDDRSRTCCSALTFSPGTTWRLPTMPEIGATRLASLTPMRDDRELRLRRLELRAGRIEPGLRGLQRGRRDEVLAARPTLAVCWRSASSSVACAESTIAERSLTRRLQVGEVDLADRLPGLDPAALAHRQRQQGAAPPWPGPPRCAAPPAARRTRSPAGISASTGRATSGGGEFERHGGLFLALAFAARLGRAVADARHQGQRHARSPPGPSSAPPPRVRRRVFLDEIFMAASVGLDADRHHVMCDQLRIRGVRRQATVTKRRPAAGLPRARPGSGAARSSTRARQQLATATSETPLAAQKTAAKPKRSLSAPPADTAENARGAVAEHRVQRLAAAAQPPREVAREHGDAGRMLGGEGQGVEQLGDTTRTTTCWRRRRSRRSAAPTRRRPGPASRAPAADYPAALEGEPGHLDRHPHRPEQADRSLAVAERGQVERIEGIEAGVRQHGEKGAGEEPGDDRLAQDGQGALDHRLGLRRLARRRQPEGGPEQQRRARRCKAAERPRHRPTRGRTRCTCRRRRSRPSPRAGPGRSGRCRPAPGGSTWCASTASLIGTTPAVHSIRATQTAAIQA